MNTKICTKCKKEKTIESFFIKNKKTGKRKAQCGECEKESKNKYYHNNRERVSKNVYQAKKLRIEVARKFVLEYLNLHPCIDCGEKDVVVLEFDHLKDKNKGISKMVSEGYNTQKILEEINKCVVRCANCHRRKTAKQFNFYRSSH